MGNIIIILMMIIVTLSTLPSQRHAAAAHDDDDERAVAFKQHAGVSDPQQGAQVRVEPGASRHLPFCFSWRETHHCDISTCV